MAVTHTQRYSSAALDYIGLSTDTKPSPDQSGSLFYESDTGKTYIYANSAWTEYRGPTIVGGTVTIGSALPAGEAHIGEVGGRKKVVTVEFTRPADTTAYAAKDVVCTTIAALLTFDLARVVGGSGTLTKLRLWTDQSTNVAIYRLHFYHTAPTAIADNAPFTLLWANRAKRSGFIDVGPCATEGTGSDAANAQNADVRLPFVCAAADRNLYAIVETLTAFTPASAQQYFLAVTADLD